MLREDSCLAAPQVSVCTFCARKASKLSTWEAAAWGGAEAESCRMLAAREMARYHDGSVTAVRDRRCHVWGQREERFLCLVSICTFVLVKQVN